MSFIIRLDFSPVILKNASQKGYMNMADSVPILQLSHLSETERTALLTRAEADLTSFLEQVRPILDRVRNEGDHALMDFAMRFDGVEKPMISIRCDQREFTSAERSLPRDVKEAIAYAAENIRRFHESQMPSDTPMREVRPGVFAGEKTTPIPSVACYVPRGKGAFPSVALMTTLPAVVAGVSRILVMTPPGPDGTVDPATLYAAQIAGVTEVYKCGRAQGIAAVAYGTETVPKTIKVVGPGSPWVVAAKRLLADRIDTGLPAGPSESIVLADRTADPQIAALDLIVESEHGPDSSAFLVTDNREIAQSVQAAIPLFWKGLSPARASFSSTVLTGPHGGILLAETMAEAIDFQIHGFSVRHIGSHAGDGIAQSACGSGNGRMGKIFQSQDFFGEMVGRFNGVRSVAQYHMNRIRKIGSHGFRP
jgi:histidinol dehydrogenase